MKNKVKSLGVISVADTVTAIDTHSWPYSLSLESGDTVHALSVIIATGADPKKLGVPGEKEFWGYGVTSCATCDAPFRKGQDVVVVGGGDSAVEEAIQLAPYAKKVTILVRKDSMRAAPRMQERLKSYSNITIEYNVEIKEILGEEVITSSGFIKEITGVHVVNNRTKSDYIMDVKGVFLAIGHNPNTHFVRDSLDCDANGYLKLLPSTQQTSIPGIFAAGDVADHNYRQAITAAGFGCMALLEAVEFLSTIGCSSDYINSMESRLYLPPQHGESLVREVTSLSDLQELIQQNSGKNVIVDFYAQTCPSCLQMLPLYDRVSTELQDTAVLVKVDVDKALDIVEEFHIVKVPCLMSFVGGHPQKQVYTTMGRRDLLVFAHG